MFSVSAVPRVAAKLARERFPAKTTSCCPPIPKQHRSALRASSKLQRSLHSLTLPADSRSERTLQQLLDRRSGGGERDGAALAIGQGLLQVDAQRVVDRSQQVAGSQRSVMGLSAVACS